MILSWNHTAKELNKRGVRLKELCPEEWDYYKCWPKGGPTLARKLEVPKAERAF